VSEDGVVPNGNHPALAFARAPLLTSEGIPQRDSFTAIIFKVPHYRNITELDRSTGELIMSDL